MDHASRDSRDIPVPPYGTVALENSAYQAFVVPVNGYKEGGHMEPSKRQVFVPDTAFKPDRPLPLSENGPV